MPADTARASASRGPTHSHSDGSTTYRNLVFSSVAGVFDLTVTGEKVSAITKSDGSAEFLCLPPLADLHVHANRAFTPPVKRPRGLEDAVQNVRDVFASFSTNDYRAQAAMFYEAAYQNGTTRIRTHADVGRETKLAAVQGSLQAATDSAAKLDVEVVAFAASSSDPATAEGAELLREAIALGAHYLGAVPAFCEDPRASIDALLDLAIELEMPVDLHLDEHLDAASSHSEYLATAVIERGLHGRATLSHGCAIAELEGGARERTIRKLADARVTVIALPRTNLYLQDSQGGSPRRRGITPLRELVDAGVAVRFASDNVRDAFYPYGDGDLLGVAMDGILASQLDDPAEVTAAICNGRRLVSEHDSADLVLLPGDSLDSVLANPPRDRWLIQAGELLECSA